MDEKSLEQRLVAGSDECWQQKKKERKKEKEEESEAGEAR